ncbi:MAG: 50S ribosomal protein L10 [Acidimicrobiales bacterium]
MLKGLTSPPDEAKSRQDDFLRAARRQYQAAEKTKGVVVAGPRADKIAAVEEIHDHFERAGAAILTEYRGLKVGDLAVLRGALRGVGAEYKIYKNTLVKRAAVTSGRAGIDHLLAGPTAIAFVDGDVAPVARVLRDFSRTNPALVVKGSLLGADLLDARSTSALADLPSRELLLAHLAGALQAPMSRLAALLQAPSQNLAFGMSALLDKKRGEAGIPAASSDARSESAPGEPEATGADAPSEETTEPEAVGPAVTEPETAGPAVTEPEATAPKGDAPATDAGETGETGEAGQEPA